MERMRIRHQVQASSAQAGGLFRYNFFAGCGINWDDLEEDTRTFLDETSSRSVNAATAAPLQVDTIIIDDDSDDEVQHVQPTTSASSTANESTLNVHNVDHTCKICKTREIRSVCLPCGHFCICQTCYNQMPKQPIEKCPVCCEPVASYKNIFF